MGNSDTPPARRVERSDLMTLDDVRNRVGMSRNGAEALVERAGFPEPFAVIWRSRLWRTVDVERWVLEQLAAGYVYEPRHAGDSCH